MQIFMEVFFVNLIENFGTGDYDNKTMQNNDVTKNYVK